MVYYTCKVLWQNNNTIDYWLKCVSYKLVELNRKQISKLLDLEKEKSRSSAPTKSLFIEEQNRFTDTSNYCCRKCVFYFPTKYRNRL